MAGVAHRRGRGGHGHAVALRAGAHDLGRRGHVEVETAGAELGACGGGVVQDLEDLNDVQLGSGGFDVQLFHGGGDIVELGRGVVDVEVHGGGAGLDRLEVVGLVMRDADQVHAVIGYLQGVMAVGVRLGAGGLLHGLLQADEHDVVAGRGLAGCPVGDRTGKVRRGRRRQRQEAQQKRKGVAETLAEGHV